jgi:hypothetical protein
VTLSFDPKSAVQETTYCNTHFLLLVLGEISSLHFHLVTRLGKKESGKRKKTGEEREREK